MIIEQFTIVARGWIAVWKGRLSHSFVFVYVPRQLLEISNKRIAVRGIDRLTFEWLLSWENNWWLGWKWSLNTYIQYALLMEGKMMAGAFGQARNYGRDSPFNVQKNKRRLWRRRKSTEFICCSELCSYHTFFLFNMLSLQCGLQSAQLFLSICFARNFYTAATWTSSSSSSSSSSMSLPASLPFKCCVHSFGVGAVVISLSISDIRPSFHSLWKLHNDWATCEEKGVMKSNKVTLKQALHCNFENVLGKWKHFLLETDIKFI